MTMTDDADVDWRKTAYIGRLMWLVGAVGFVYFLVLAFLPPLGRGVRSALFLFALYLVALMVVYLITRGNKLIPRRFGISREKLHLQYREKHVIYHWKEISRIYSQRAQASTKLVIESVDGQVFPIPFLLKNERERIIGYYENLKKLSKPA